ncbi:ABC transporter permease subunit [Paenibacillus spongiae]|uniref:ABC transporter permease subunit n=1 Tax=Paenibacillus spongiae TaxID=2909671 RepID=A0ABY5SHR2_9BACL|nr:ABC transporter permease subunit [Paenibacillus spongiae]UVI33561.1 ABC transporter permease subunit [Paenibacillus spongiae]
MIKRYGSLYVMIIPVLAYFILFTFYPLVRGLIISMQEFRVIGDRPFVGFSNYAIVLQDPVFWQTMVNTVLIGGGTLIIGFIAPIIVALSLNEVIRAGFKKFTQMVIYFPHLFSWVVVGGIWIYMLSPDNGLVNGLLKLLGMDQPIHFMAEKEYARWIMIFSNVWKEMGYNCILYLAAMVSINPSLYEAADMDGAGRWQKIRYVTIPQLKSTMKVVFLINLLGVFKIFDQIVVMSNGVIARQVDVVMGYTYQKTFIDFKMGVATAAAYLVIILTLVLAYVIRKAIRYDDLD